MARFNEGDRVELISATMVYGPPFDLKTKQPAPQFGRQWRMVGEIGTVERVIGGRLLVRFENGGKYAGAWVDVDRVRAVAAAK